MGDNILTSTPAWHSLCTHNAEVTGRDVTSILSVCRWIDDRSVLIMRPDGYACTIHASFEVAAVGDPEKWKKK